MASETKVGLLAGLAFIICFAVILANRGQLRRQNVDYRSVFAANEASSTALGSETTPLTPRANSADLRAAQAAARPSPTNRVPQNSGFVGEYQPDRQGSTSEQNAHPTRPAPAAGGTELRWTPDSRGGRKAPVLRTERPRSGRVADSFARSVEQGATFVSDPLVRDNASGGSSSGDTALTALSGDPKAATRDLQEYLSEREPHALARRREQVRSDEPRHRSLRRSTPTTAGDVSNGRASHVTGAKYVVVRGDTLTSIVHKQYGKRAKRLIDAVLDANRSILADPDVLKVGMELLLPNVPSDRRVSRPSASPGRGQGVSSVTTGRKSSGERSSSDFRWYQVRRNDRYMSIARDQLGDGNRWREIYELNKDKFPDPDRIREGVRIKLPAERGVKNGRR